MRVLELSAGVGFRIAEREPAVPQQGEVLVEVLACGLCGSDVSMMQVAPMLGNRVLGHEIAGRVVADDGGRAPGPGTGPLVAILPAPRCDLLGIERKCTRCSSGKSHLCDLQARKTLGLGVDGGFAEYVVVAKGQCFEFSRDLPPELAALSEPLAVVLHAMNVAEIRDRASRLETERVVVVGAGPIGLLLVVELIRAGHEVVVVERGEYRRGLATRLGASLVVADLAKLDTKGGVGTVFDCTGDTEAVERAIAAVSPGGKLVLVGASKPGQVLRFDGLSLLVREISILPAMAYTNEEFGIAVRAIEQAPESYSPLLTHKLSFSEASVALPSLLAGGEYGKLTLVPQL